jgi:uncharacterized protein YegJ (DUF2314 family)
MRFCRVAGLCAAVLIGALFDNACSSHAKAPASLSMGESISFEYAIYLLPSPKPAIPLQLLHSALKRYPALNLVDKLAKNPDTMLLYGYLKEDVANNYAPPDLKSLPYHAHGLSDQQAEALQHSTNALILDFSHPKKNVWQALRVADELAEELARKSGGLIWDEETREVYSPDAWHEKRLASWSDEIPDVSGQTVIHVYPNGDFARAITLGMSKMGLPDVVVQETPWSSDNQVGNLINIFSQSIAERQTPHKGDQYRLDLHAIKNLRMRANQLKDLKGNANAVACLTLSEAKWEEGDPKNRLVRLDADQYPGDDAHAKQDSMISSFFGWQDSLVKVEHSRELLAESAKEKSKLPVLRKLFNAGLAPGEFIEVKAPFSAENGNREWMWVEVTSWKGEQITGTLENDPAEVKTLQAGQIVQVREQDVFDYIHQFADKRTEGNTTGEIIRKMSESEIPATAGATVPSCPTD